MNNNNSEKENIKFRRKYIAMKKRIKSLILENAAICDEVAKIQESILIVKNERKFLLRKLMEFENNADSSMYFKSDSNNGPNIKIKRKRCDDTGKSM